MADIVIPAALRHARSSFRYIDQTGVTRGVYTGAAQTVSFGGDRVGATIEFTPHGGRTAIGKSERAQLQALMFATRGKQNRIYTTDSSYVQRGSFPAPELFTNYDFSSGTTGWSVGAKYALTAADGILRATVSDGSQSTSYPAYQNGLSITNYAPYALRALIRAGRGAFASIYPLCQNATNSPITSGYGVHSTAGLTDATFGLYDSSTSGNVAGDYLDILFMSAARCFLVDGGGNLLTDSDAFGSWTASGLTATSNNTVAADGTTTADSVAENGASSEHYVQKAYTAAATANQDFTFSIDINASTRSWWYISIYELTGSTAVSAYVNAATGATGTVGNGTNWSGGRVTAVSRGNGWYRFTITGKKTNTATSLVARVQSATADGASLVFAGNSSTVGRLWRGNLKQASVPTVGNQTTSLAVAASTQTGSALYVNGLPASTNGLLVQGDWIEIDGQIKQVQGSLNSDAAGIGYLQFLPPLRRAVADGTPIIVNKPMGKFLFAGDNPSWDNVPGVFSSASLDLEEAFS